MPLPYLVWQIIIANGEQDEEGNIGQVVGIYKHLVDNIIQYYFSLLVLVFIIVPSAYHNTCKIHRTQYTKELVQEYLRNKTPEGVPDNKWYRKRRYERDKQYEQVTSYIVAVVNFILWISYILVSKGPVLDTSKCSRRVQLLTSQLKERTNKILRPITNVIGRIRYILFIWALTNKQAAYANGISTGAHIKGHSVAYSTPMIQSVNLWRYYGIKCIKCFRAYTTEHNNGKHDDGRFVSDSKPI
jgi:hypothetical protein